MVYQLHDLHILQHRRPTKIPALFSLAPIFSLVRPFWLSLFHTMSLDSVWRCCVNVQLCSNGAFFFFIFCAKYQRFLSVVLFCSFSGVRLLASSRYYSLTQNVYFAILNRNKEKANTTTTSVCRIQTDMSTPLLLSTTTLGAVVSGVDFMYKVIDSVRFARSCWLLHAFLPRKIRW